MSDDLTKRLRAGDLGYNEAAVDCIEQLERERDELFAESAKKSAKLAEAMECLQWIMDHRGEYFIPAPWDDMANDLLAELEGK